MNGAPKRPMLLGRLSGFFRRGIALWDAAHLDRSRRAINPISFARKPRELRIFGRHHDVVIGPETYCTKRARSTVSGNVCRPQVSTF